MRSRESDQVLAEHEALRVRIGELQSLLAAFGASPTDPERWSAEVAQGLVQLHDRVRSHFRMEEESGVLTGLGEDHPRALLQVRNLLGQHGEILSGFRAVVADAMAIGEHAKDAVPALLQSVHGVLKMLARHEREETALLTNLVYEDLGVGG